MTGWDKIREEWETTKITLKDLAKKHGIKYSTLTTRKRRENWSKHGNKGNQNAKGNKGGSAPKGNKNAKGNSGGAAPSDNKNAVSHGLFANFLPKETLQIMSELHTMSPADMIWQNILIQYTAIIRAQKIMFVRDEHDSYSNITGIKLNPEYVDKEGNPVKVEENREWHMAYERHEKFLNAQSRAISTLSNLIKQFVALASEDDKRRLELEAMQASLNKTVAESKLAQAKVDKLEASGKGFELLEALMRAKQSGVTDD